MATQTITDERISAGVRRMQPCAWSRGIMWAMGMALAVTVFGAQQISSVVADVRVATVKNEALARSNERAVLTMQADLRYLVKTVREIREGLRPGSNTGQP